jgi:phage replication O-like protein O
MANPQKENGYTPIANELFDFMIAFHIPRELRQVFDFIIRKTYGFQRKEDHISNSQIVKATGQKKGNVSRGLSRLIAHQLVIKTDNNSTKGHTLKINKDYHQWIPLVIKTDNKLPVKKKLSKRKPKLSKTITPVIKTDNKRLSKVRDTKERKETLKETIQKKGGNLQFPTPKELSEKFFKGVEDLTKKIESEEAKSTQLFLQQLNEKYKLENMSHKKALWDEIRNFSSYWTELTHGGKKQKYECQKTFEVPRRLSTWLSRTKQFQEKTITGEAKGKKLIWD